MNKNVFKQGNTVEFAGQKWNVLDEVGENNFLCVNSDIICYKAFDNNNNNNWRVSSLREYLNGEYLEKFKNVNLVVWSQDLTTDDGLKDYGSSTDAIFLLTADQYRQYRQYMSKLLDETWWLITANSTTDYSVRRVNTIGALDNALAFNGCYGVRPACVIHFKSKEEAEQEYKELTAAVKESGIALKLQKELQRLIDQEFIRTEQNKKEFPVKCEREER